MLFSKRDLAKIVIPLIIQQLLAVTIGAADSVMVAYAGEAAVSGVSLINTLDTLLVMVFTSLVAGGGVVVAQSLGRGDPALARSSSKQLLPQNGQRIGSRCSGSWIHFGHPQPCPAPCSWRCRCLR